jgi:CheY-like chemotaxis protein
MGDRRGALLRAYKVRDVLRGARLLWVDDNPASNEPLVEMLHGFGVVVDSAISTDEALTLARRHRYDVIVSDIERDGNAEAGLEMRADMEANGTSRWTIFYVQQLRTATLAGGKYEHAMVPPGAFAITNRPDHLLHYIIDVLERERWETVEPPVAL